MPDLPNITTMTERERDEEIAIVQGYRYVGKEGFAIGTGIVANCWLDENDEIVPCGCPDYADPALNHGLLMELFRNGIIEAYHLDDDGFQLWLYEEKVSIEGYPSESPSVLEKVPEEAVKSAWIAWNRRTGETGVVTKPLPEKYRHDAMPN